MPDHCSEVVRWLWYAVGYLHLELRNTAKQNEAILTVYIYKAILMPPSKGHKGVTE